VCHHCWGMRVCQTFRPTWPNTACGTCAHNKSGIAYRYGSGQPEAFGILLWEMTAGQRALQVCNVWYGAVWCGVVWCGVVCVALLSHGV
jgi:hypothetical protein